MIFALVTSSGNEIHSLLTYVRKSFLLVVLIIVMGLAL